ncbi:MAG: hypothetical protein JWQ78_730 [Sediminibacterium sp.]|nr:hypothetical protein [Sediminibacterium sp.]
MKKRMRQLRRLGTVLVWILAIFSALTLISSQNAHLVSRKITRAVGENVVLMELFTSQGCSSCPPADALLAEYALAHNEHIIPISFHVDYWNRLGWKDPFSNSTYSSRQQWYSRTLPGHSVYTPQLVVNGKAEVVGNNRAAVKRVVDKELLLHNEAALAIDAIKTGKDAVSFHYTVSNYRKDAWLNIALVQKQAVTGVAAGENKGVSITNRNIVRSFHSQDAAASGSAQVEIPPSFNADDYALVVFVQNKKDLTIPAAVFKEF